MLRKWKVLGYPRGDPGGIRQSPRDSLESPLLPPFPLGSPLGYPPWHPRCAPGLTTPWVVPLPGPPLKYPLGNPQGCLTGFPPLVLPGYTMGGLMFPKP